MRHRLLLQLGLTISFIAACASSSAQTCAVRYAKLGSAITDRLDNLLQQGQINPHEQSLIASEMSRVQGTKQEIKLGSQRYLQLVARSAWDRREAIRREVNSIPADYKLDVQAVRDLERRLIDGQAAFNGGKIDAKALETANSEAAARRVYAFQMSEIAGQHGLSDVELEQVKTKFPALANLKKDPAAVERYVRQLRTPQPTADDVWKQWEGRATAWETRLKDRSPEQIESMRRPLFEAEPGTSLSEVEEKANRVARYYADFGQYPPSVDSSDEAKAYRALISDDEAGKIRRKLEDRISEIENGEVARRPKRIEAQTKIFKSADELDFKLPNSTIEHPLRFQVQTKGRAFDRFVVFEAAAWEALAERPLLADGIRRHLQGLSRLEVDRANVAVLNTDRGRELFEIPIKNGAHYRPFGCLKDNVYTIKIVIVAPSTLAGYRKDRRISDLCK